MNSTTADLMKLQESSRRMHCVVAVKSSLALRKMFHAGAYNNYHTSAHGNCWQHSNECRLSSGRDIAQWFGGTDEWRLI